VRLSRGLVGYATPADEHHVQGSSLVGCANIYINENICTIIELESVEGREFDDLEVAARVKPHAVRLPWKERTSRDSHLLLYSVHRTIASAHRTTL
jgi:hypothetical protein